MEGIYYSRYESKPIDKREQCDWRPEKFGRVVAERQGLLSNYTFIARLIINMKIFELVLENKQLRAVRTYMVYL